VTMVEPAQTVPDNTPFSTKRFVGIVAIYLFIGPPIGGIVFWIEMLGVDLGRGHVVLPGVVPAFFVMVVFSYPIGAPFAFVAGIVHAFCVLWLRQTSILVPFITACAVSAVAVAVIVWMTPNEFKNFWGEFRSGLKLMLPVSLIATLACWWLARRWVRAA
jgi:hypothetical protein